MKKSCKDKLVKGFYWFIIDYIEMLAKQMVLHADFSSNDLRKADIEWLREIMKNTLAGMANTVELVEKLKEDRFYSHFLGFDYINNVALPDLLVAKNGKAVLVECKGKLSEDEARKEYENYKQRWGKKIDEILKKTGFKFLLAYKDKNINKWCFLLEEDSILKKLEYEDFMNLFK